MKKLFSRAFGQKWPPVWRHDAARHIWLLKFSGTGAIVLELRDITRRQASFACLDEETGAVRWRDLALEEPWWVGIDDLDRDILFLHGYRKPDMPQHLGITAVDLATGRTLWHEPQRTFQFAFGDRVYAAQQGFESMRYVALDRATGALAEDLGTDATALHGLRMLLNAEDRFAGYAYPSEFTEQHPDYGRFRTLVAEAVPAATLRGPVDVLVRDPYLLVSWHAATGSDGKGGHVHDQHFMAFDTATGARVFADRINSGVPIPTIDSFFVKDDRVYYIAHGRVLTAHSLTAS